MTARGAAVRRTHVLSAAVVLHVWVACFVASALTGVWAAPEQASATRHLGMLAVGGLVHGLIWVVGRRAPLHRVAMVGAALAGAVGSAYFLTQYRHVVTDAKVTLPHAIGQATSTFSPPLGWWTPQANTVGTLLDGLLCVAVGLALARGPVRLRVVGAGTAAIMAVGVVVSASRGSWLAVAAALVVATLVALPGRKPSPALVVGAAALVVLGVVATATAPGVPWWMRLAALAGRPDRLEVYRHALTLVRDTTFTGIGAGDQFASALSTYALLIQVPYLTYAHNLALDLWLEQGLPGLVTWWALAAAVAGAAVAGERARLGWRFRGVWAGLLAIHLHGLTDARQSVDAWTWLPYFVLTGALAAQLTRHQVQLSRAWALAPLALAVAVGGAALAGRGPALGAWHANLGALAQARGDRLAAPAEARRSAVMAEARASFDRALQRNARDVSALRRVALLDLDAARYTEAAGHLRVAWREDPENLTTRKAFGLAAVWTADLDLAARLLRALPGMPAELNTWSHWRQSRGERTLALAAARVSLRLDPAQPDIADRVRALEVDLPAGVTAVPRR